MKWLLEQQPSIGTAVFIAPGARVMGAVSIGDYSSVFYNSVVRADINTITIGARSNIQDNCTLHVADDFPVEVGMGVTVGHQVVLHGCRIEDNVTIGMGAVLMNGSHIARDSIVAAGALVTPGKSFPPGSLIMGQPAKSVRQLSDEEIAANLAMAQKYITVQQRHREFLHSGG